MRTSSPLGSARRTSPSPTDPDQSVPVATVPIPRRVKTPSAKRLVAPSARPSATQVEAAVDADPRRPLGPPFGHPVRRFTESPTELVEPLAGLRARDDHLGA